MRELLGMTHRNAYQYLQSKGYKMRIVIKNGFYMVIDSNPSDNTIDVRVDDGYITEIIKN